MLSLVVPGAGQLYLGLRTRGLAILGAVAGLVALLSWLDMAYLYIILVPFWLWNAWDARQQARGQRSAFSLGFLLLVVVVYAMGWQVTEIDLTRLVQGLPRIRPVVASLVQPDVVTREPVVVEAINRFESPCSASPSAEAASGAAGVATTPPSPEPGSPAQGQATAPPSPEPGSPAQGEGNQPYLLAQPACGAVGTTVTLHGGNFPPSQEGSIRWENPIGQERQLRRGGEFVTFETNAQGQFSLDIEVPDVVPERFRERAQIHEIKAQVVTAAGAPELSETFWLVVQRMGETIAQALMATTLGILLAVPVSFFGARNIMAVNPLGTTIYYLTRTLLNILRSIEPLIMAIVFVVWVGLGPFAGVLALVVHSIAALGKLYSESIESIDPGPIEAITATGANRAQVVVYAVLPQVLPPFVAFSVYRWDINVRMSTILGFVGGGGIGFLLQQWIRLSEYNEAATAIWAIAIVVTVLDYASAQVRERIV